jgi:hypothetical protein
MTSPRMPASLETGARGDGEVRVHPGSCYSPGGSDETASDQNSFQPSCGAALQHIEA